MPDTPLPRRFARLPANLRWSLLTLAALIALALVAPWLSPFDPETPDWNAVLQPPSLASGHWFGTDAIGRDIFVRSFLGLRLSLLIGLLATAMALLIGLCWGAIAGYFGGRLERLLMRLLDVFSALPFLLLVILLLALFGRSFALLLLAIGGYVWIELARVVRAEAARLRGQPFVTAAVVTGASPWQVLRWHLLPNLLGLALVYASLIAANAVLIESFLGFLGLGVAEPASGLGSLLHDGSQELDQAPWTLLFPAVLLVATLACFQQLGDALRDAMDPRRQ